MMEMDAPKPLKMIRLKTKEPVKITACRDCPCQWHSAGFSSVCHLLGCANDVPIGINPHCPLEDWKP
jgi:hypothetical protein